MKKNYLLIAGVLLLLLVGGYFGVHEYWEKENQGQIFDNYYIITSEDTKEDLNTKTYTQKEKIGNFIGYDNERMMHFVIDEKCNNSKIFNENNFIFHCLNVNEYLEGSLFGANKYITSKTKYNGEDLVEYKLKIKDLITDTTIKELDIIHYTTIEVVSDAKMIVLTNSYYGFGDKISLINSELNNINKLNIRFNNIQIKSHKDSIYALLYQDELNSKHSLINLKNGQEVYSFNNLMKDKYRLEIDENLFYLISNTEIIIIKRSNFELLNNIKLNEKISDLDRVYLDNGLLFIPFQNKSIKIYNMEEEVKLVNNIPSNGNFPFLFKKIKNKKVVGYFKPIESEEVYSLIISKIDDSLTEDVLYKASGLSASEINRIPHKVKKQNHLNELIFVKDNDITIIE